MKKTVCLSLLILLTINLMMAQENDAEVLSDVIVLSDKIPITFQKQNRNIQIITAKDMEQISANSVNELLTYVAGIDVRQKGPNGTQADIGIDGGTFDQTLILINGIKMSDPQTGHNMMNLPIPLDAIERIEVLRGPAGSVYGVNALMGVINIVTKSNKNELLIGVSTGSSFSHDDSTGKMYYNYSLSAVKNFSSEKTQQLVAASFDKGNGHRYNTAFQNIKLLYAGDWKITNTSTLKWTMGYVDNDFGASYFYASPRDKEASEQVKSAVVGLNMPIQIKENWTLQPYVNYKYGYDHYLFVRQNPSIFENIHHTHSIDAGMDNIVKTKYGIFNLGVNVRNESITSTNLGERERMNFGAFFAYQKQFSNFDLNAGLYLNKNSVFGLDVYPGIDLGYQVNDNWRLYVNAGMGQRMPTFTDLYYSDPNNLGNDQLRPEYLSSYELGTKYNEGNLYFNTSISYKDGRDFIDWVRADTSLPWQVRNFTSLHTFAYTFDYGQSWRASALTRINWQVAYTYLQPSIGTPSNPDLQNLQSRYAVNALQHQLQLRVAAQFSQRLEMSVGNRLLKRLNTPDKKETYQLSTYNLLDFKVAYRIGKVTITADVNNLLNVQYIESGVVPMPGAWLSLGAKIKM